MKQVVNQRHARPKPDQRLQLHALGVVQKAGVDAHAGHQRQPAQQRKAVLQKQPQVHRLRRGRVACAGLAVLRSALGEGLDLAAAWVGARVAGVAGQPGHGVDVASSTRHADVVLVVHVRKLHAALDVVGAAQAPRGVKQRRCQLRAPLLLLIPWAVAV